MKNTKRTFWNIWNLVLSVLFIGLGIVTCAFCANKDFQNVIILIVGIFLLTIAGLQIIAHVFRIIFFGSTRTLKTDLSVATVTASELAMGVITVMVAFNQGDFEILFKYLGYFTGILLISIGAIIIIYEIVFIVRKIGSVTLSILAMFLALIPIVLGIVFIVFLSDQAHLLTLIFVILGIGLILFGLCYMAIVIFKMRAERVIDEVLDDAENNPEPTPYIDVTVEEHVHVSDDNE